MHTTRMRRKALGAAGALAALYVVAALGESRPAADSMDSVTAQSPVIAAGANRMLEVGVDADGASDLAIAEGDDALLVPAVYARDPDVRFIYYRQVSKWM